MHDVDKHDFEIDKTKEPRKKGISRMIDEGGLGAETYYDIKKDIPKDLPEKVFKDDED